MLHGTLAVIGLLRGQKLTERRRLCETSTFYLDPVSALQFLTCYACFGGKTRVESH